MCYENLLYFCQMETTLLKLHVPEYILLHFEYDHVEEISGVIRIHLIEKKDARHYPKELIGKGAISMNGYMNPIELQTFPTQGKEVFLLLKRRRWKLKGDDKSYYNTYSFCQEGMKATKEFGAFLKEIGRG